VCRGGREKGRTHLDGKPRTGSVDDDFNALDCLIESAVSNDVLLENERLDATGVLVAVLFDPSVGLLLLTNGKANGMTALEQEEGNTGTDVA
jgi:hypothetical protein